jgi:small-conductance mechanosensitive channel
MAAMTGMGLLAALTGFGWQISPLATGSALLLVAVPAVALLVIRHGGSALAAGRPPRQNDRIEEVSN